MIQTETTPNPDSLKFLCEKTLSAIGTEEFKKEKEKEIKIPFVKELLNFKGVELILLSEKFLSVKKNKEVSWSIDGKSFCQKLAVNIERLIQFRLQIEEHSPR